MSADKWSVKASPVMAMTSDAGSLKFEQVAAEPHDRDFTEPVERDPQPGNPRADFFGREERKDMLQIFGLAAPVTTRDAKLAFDASNAAA